MIARCVVSALPVAALAAGSLIPAVALAEAWTYQGTLGKSAIAVEFTRDPTDVMAKAPLAGRYFYLSQGVDIPLQPGEGSGTIIALNEEKSCTASICKEPPEGQASRPPIGAAWSLKAGVTGSLSGTWKGTGAASSLPVRLERVAGRPTGKDFDGTPQGLVDLTDQRIWSSARPIGRQATPYEFIKMQVPLTPSEETVLGDVAFRYVVDPRTRFRYPRIARLPGVADVAHAPANQYLEARHWVLNVGALECKAQQYQAFGWNDVYASAYGTLGGYDEQTIDVTYLSPRLMSWTEAGSLFCGGAHPANFMDSYTIDVVKGAAFDMSRVFKGWVARQPGDPEGPIVSLDVARAAPGSSYSWGPDKELVAFVEANRPKEGARMEQDCGMSDLVQQNLALRFAEGERVVFALEGLPHAIVACGGDLFDRPISDVRALLTPDAADYFPSLKR